MPVNGLLWTTVALTLGTALLRRERLQIPAFTGDKLLLLAVVALLLPALIANPWNAGYLKLMGLLGGLSFLVGLRLGSIDQRTVLWAIMVYGCIEGLAGLGQVFGITLVPWGYGLPVGSRPVGVFQQPNVLASFLATSLAAAFFSLARVSNDKQYIHASGGSGTARDGTTFLALGTIAIATACIMVSGSRTGWLGFGVVTAGSFLLPWDREHGPAGKANGFLAMLAGCVAGGLILLQVDAAAAQLDSKANLASLRWQFYPQVLALIGATLPWGCGYGFFEACYVNGVAARASATAAPVSGLSHPHNEILYWVTEAGISGLIAILLAMTAFLVILRANKKGNVAWLVLLAVPILIHAQLEMPLLQSAPHWLALVAILHLAQQATGGPTATIPIQRAIPLVRIGGLLATLLLTPVLLHSVLTNAVVWSIRDDFMANSKYLKYVGHPLLLQKHYEYELYQQWYLSGLSVGNVGQQDAFMEWAGTRLQFTPRIPVFHAMARTALAQGDEELAREIIARAEYLFPSTDHQSVLGVQD